MRNIKEKIDLRDFLQIIIGSLGGAFAFAPTEELNSISTHIPWSKLVVFIVATMVFVGLIAYCMGIRNLTVRSMLTIWNLPVRIFLIYGISIFSCTFALWMYGYIPGGSPLVSVVRKIIVLALPATAGGTLVDLIETKHRKR